MTPLRPGEDYLLVEQRRCYGRRASTSQQRLALVPGVDILLDLVVDAPAFGLAVDARDLHGTLEDLVDLLDGPGVVALLALCLEGLKLISTSA
jgi:hypothetical protein